MTEQPIGERLVLANERVRVWEDVVEPRGEQPVHTHRNPYLSVMLTRTRAQVVDGNGNVLYDVDRQPGEVTWFGDDAVPRTHTLRNLGDEQIRVVVVELLGAADGPIAGSST